MDNQLTPSPNTFQDAVIDPTMDFPNAIREIMKGRRVTRQSWGNQDEYGFLYDGFLTIHTQGVFHRWLVSDGDLEGMDWVTLPEAN